MISWRWPRPMAVMASMALMPVCSGSWTAWRCTTVGACSSRARRPLGARSRRGRRSAGRAGSTTRPRKPSPTGTERISPVRLTCWPSSIAEPSPRMTTPISRTSRFSAMPERAVLELEQLVGHRAGQALDAWRCRHRSRRRRRPPRARPRASRTRRSSRSRSGSHPRRSSARSSHVPVSCSGTCMWCCHMSGCHGTGIRRTPGPSVPASAARAAAERCATLPSMTSSPTRMIRPPRMDGSTATRNVIGLPYIWLSVCARRRSLVLGEADGRGHLARSSVPGGGPPPRAGRRSPARYCACGRWTPRSPATGG